ncbi:MAG: hypothetical protein IPH72_20265 [Sandaracinaceae bacterium]|nr:hypothetical protein [Sandaracinaceae bacterium]
MAALPGPARDVSGSGVDHFLPTAQTGAVQIVGYVVRLRRRGEEASAGDLELRQFFLDKAQGLEEQRQLANDLALRVAALLDLPVDRGS